MHGEGIGTDGPHGVHRDSPDESGEGIAIGTDGDFYVTDTGVNGGKHTGPDRIYHREVPV